MISTKLQIYYPSKKYNKYNKNLYLFYDTNKMVKFI